MPRTATAPAVAVAAPSAPETEAEAKVRAKNYQRFAFAILIHNDAVSSMPSMDQLMRDVCAEAELVLNIREGKSQTSYKVDTIDTARGAQPTMFSRAAMAKLRESGITADEILARLGLSE